MFPVEDILRGRPRLQAIAGLVPENCRCLADIGTDHGYIPAELVRSGRVKRAVAADIGPGPLGRARQTAARYGVANRIDFRLGDGLAVLAPGEAEVIVIAGMGGDHIADILAAAPWSRSRDGPLFLLQPMSRAETLRRWLVSNGWRVRAERLVQDKGVLYPILTASGAPDNRQTELSGADAWGGFLLGNDPLWGLYLEGVILRLRRAAAGLEKAQNPDLARRREDFLCVITELEKRKGEWERADGTRN